MSSKNGLRANKVLFKLGGRERGTLNKDINKKGGHRGEKRGKQEQDVWSSTNEAGQKAL